MIYQCKCTNNKSLSTNGDEQRSLSRESDDHQLAGPGFILSYNNNYHHYFLSPYLSQPLSSPQPDWVKVFISATVANIVLKKLNMQFWMKSLFTLSQILKQHHWQPVPNDEMTSPYSWVIIRKIFLVWVFYIDGFTNLILPLFERIVTAPFCWTSWVFDSKILANVCRLLAFLHLWLQTMPWNMFSLYCLWQCSTITW